MCQHLVNIPHEKVANSTWNQIPMTFYLIQLNCHLDAYNDQSGAMSILSFQSNQITNYIKLRLLLVLISFNFWNRYWVFWSYTLTLVLLWMLLHNTCIFFPFLYALVIVLSDPLPSTDYCWQKVWRILPIASSWRKIWRSSFSFHILETHSHGILPQLIGIPLISSILKPITF